MADEVHSISRLTNPEDGTTTLVVGTFAPSDGAGHLFVGESSFTEISAGFGVEPFSMVAWHPFLDQTAWMYVTDDVQSRRTDVPGNDVKVGITRPNRHGANNEFVSIIQPTVSAVVALTIYDLATGDDVTAAADWASSWSDYLVTGDTQTIPVEKLSQIAVGGSLNAVTGSALFDAPVIGTEFARSTVNVFGRIFDIFGDQEIDMETDFSVDSRVEMFIKIGDVVKVDFIRLQFTMETPQTGMTYASSSGQFSEVIVTLVNHGYQTGDALIFQGVTGSPITSTINGYWRVRRTTDDTFQLDESSFDGTPVGGTVISFSSNSYYTDFTTDQLTVGSTFTVDFATSAAQNTADETKLRAEYEQWLIDHDFPVGGAPGPTVSENLRAAGDAGFRFWIGNRRGDFFGIIPGGQKITSNEWFGVSIPKSAWFRGGTNPEKTWKNITGMLIGARYDGTKKGGGDDTGDSLAFAQIDMVSTESQLNSKLGGLPYDWRYTYYESETGVESNASPIMAEGIDAVNQPVTITMTGISTTIADKIRLYRRGAMLRDWHLVDTIVNPGVGTTTYVDGKSDIDIIGNQLLQLDNYPPLPLPVQVTQLLRFSERFTSPTWVKTNATVTPNVVESPRGSNTADRLTATTAGGGIAQTIADPGKETYFSIFVKAKTITGGGPHISLTNDVDAAIPITLTLPNNRPAEGGRIGAWQRVVMTCSSGITSVGITVTNLDDEIHIWGAQLDDWDAVTGFLPPARHVADLEDTTSLEVLAARQQSLLTPTTRQIAFQEGNRFIGTGVVDDTTTVLTTILEDGGPPQVWWGPWQGQVMFAIRGHKGGEVIDAGSLYWCKSGQPDAWSPFKRLPVTHSGEPLQNGFLYNTHSFVWSSEHLYRIDPDPTGRGEFVSWPTPVGRGLTFPWAFAVGPKIWFLSAGGIYETTGGPARNITAGSLIRPLFEGQTVNGMPGVDTFNADPDEIRMEFNGVYLYFFYKNLAGNRAVLRWHHIFERWEHFTHLDPVRMGKNEQETGRLLYGTNNGFITRPGGAADDHGTPINGFFRTGSLDLGTPQLEKIFGDVHVEATIPVGITVTVQPFFNDEDSSGATQNLVGTGARVRYKLTLGDDVRARSIAFEVAGIETAGVTACAIHEIAISYQLDQIAELQWDSFFEDDGSLEDKWISGLYLEANTDGVDKDIAVFVDGVEIAAEGSPFTINTLDRQPVRISFNAPVRGQQMRFTSGTVAGKLFDWRWIWVPQPVVLEEPFAWDNLSSNLEKFVKGFTIDADTLGLPVTLQLRINGNETANPLGAEEFTFTHDGRQQTQFAFDFSGANQILVEVVRLANTTSNPLQVHNLTWIFDTEPPHKDRWNTQDRSFNLPGWGLLRDGYVAIRSIADVTLTVTIDGVAQTPITLPNTSGARRKLYVQYEANKGKVFQFTLTSGSDFKVYNEDTNIWVKAWNTNVGYKQFQLPFEGGIPNP